jgi:hypothetical protein
MHHLLDILASGVHDAKNQLFVAESVITAALEAEHGIAMGEARYAIESAANRLSRTLAAYQVLRKDAAPAVTPVIVGDLCDEVVMAQQRHLALADIDLSHGLPGSRRMAARPRPGHRHAQQRHPECRPLCASKVHLQADVEDGWLLIRIEDDGPGFPSLPPPYGTGLMVAHRLAALHVRKGREGSLHLSNDASLGGARFELRLP